jgi:cytoskeletal protein CcmA (bactofilin family)
MSHSDHTLQDAFRVKKGLHVTGVSVLSGDVAIAGELRADNLEIPFETLSAKKIVWHDGLRDEQYVSSPGGNITTTTTWHPMSVIPDVYLYGTTQFRDVATFESDVHVQGDLYVDGNAYLSAGAGGVINVGDSTSDVVVFTADVNSHIIPNQNMTFDLGTADKHWQTIYTHDLSAHGSVDVTGAMSVTQGTQLNGTLDVAKRTTLHEDLHLSGAASIVGNTAVSGNTELSGTLTVDDATTINDTLDVELNTTLHGDLSVVNDTVLTGELSSKSDVHVFGDLRVDGDVWFNANNAGGTNTINLGDDDTDNVVFNADIDSNIIPNQNMTFDLGTADKHWQTIYTHDLNAHGQLSASGAVHWSGGSSVSANDVYTTTNTYSADWQNAATASKITQILTPAPGAVVDSYDHTHQKSAKYLIEVEDVSSGTGTSGAVFFTEMSVVTDGSVVSSVQYSQNYTTSDAFVEFYTTINGNDVEVKIRNINLYTNVSNCAVRINRQSTR